MQRSPSALIESISALRISDPDDSDNETASATRGKPHNGVPLLEAPPVRALLAETAANIDEIRRAIFVAEEQRHTGRFLPPPVADAADEAAGEAAQPSELDQALMSLDGQLGSVSGAMSSLEASIEALEAACTPKLGNGNGVDGEMAAWAEGRSRRDSTGSQASLSSFASFDDAVRSRNGGASGTAALRREFVALSAEWAKVQQEAETLKRELGEDKYVSVFQNVSGQASGMMDSLDKALAVCADFITSATTLRAEAADFEDEREERNARLADLRARRHVFEVKRGHYGPACEQVFGVLERGLRDRATSNGSVLRSFMELKSRWRALREAMSRMEKEMRRVEAQLLYSGHASSDSPASSSVISVASPGASSSNSGTPTRPRVGPKSSMRTSPGMPARRSPSAGNLVGIAASGIAAPPKPPKSARRLSSIGPDGPHAIPVRTSSAAYAQTPGSSSLTPPASRLRKAPSSNTMRTQEPAGRFGAVPPPHLADRPAWKGSSKVQDEVEVNERSVHVSASGRTTPGSSFSPSRPHRLRPQQDPPVPPSSYRPPGLFAPPFSARSKTPQPQPTWSRGASEPPPDLDFNSHARRAAPSVGDSSMEDVGNVSLDSFTSRPARPSSVAGMYYRPPSAAGTVTDERGNKRNSLIPRLAMQSSQGATGSRPSSAMSHASNSAFASSPRGHYAGPSRSTMQTPEPTIAARVQRLSMFAKPSRGTPSTSSPATKRSSRPPPSRYNVGTAPSVTSPLNISKTSGRTTPLSAAALAAVPHAGLPATRSVSGASSVSNFRATRSGGRATPTFSDAGNSSVGGYSAWNGGASRGGALEQYRPNPADALDVEVAYIINALGVGLERVSEPLPRGFKAEPRPGQEVQAQYSIGGAKPVMCKLLELHRPAGSAGARSGTKVRKVLARVGGGWIDLEQHVLSRLGAV
ncbi:hypothetical protein FA09DRAFT_339145 [Tilletiopsis washingtonensis]|uniref:GAR domain-containing protein n=1 Tax=Tilletiopsis washingtonensis TaxID=58919 RepID=A0A316Z9M8_9BASI|nr:hypothetical protein FA09DRAFT_339145 [Tilletiopsis washingtonensis]PWN97652.1 hypothetical protein FA09DRAFT_339145 [Tilletiopsis washingtonensis]